MNALPPPDPSIHWDAAGRALAAAGMAKWAGQQLHVSAIMDGSVGLSERAGECVQPLLRAALVALELSGLVSEDASAGVHDVIADYINAPPQRATVGVDGRADTDRRR